MAKRHAVTAPQRTIALRSGAAMPVLGLGTWRMGERRDRREREIVALRAGIEFGVTLIDTAEMYGEGEAEKIVGEAIQGQRDRMFLVSKVYPHNASRKGTPAACARSLRRLGLDHIDLYLLHWRGEHPLADTCEAMRTLVDDGRIRHWGVSNFDTDDMEEVAAVCGDVVDCVANQVYFSLSERGPEFSLLPWQRERKMPLMAYSPIDQGALATDAGLAKLAQRLSATPAQLALAWLLSRPGVVAIPKAVRESHQRENLAAANLELSPEVLTEIDRLHPPPKRKKPLAMI
jgi:diketogulonate reductase-like aldo/keto reductase